MGTLAIFIARGPYFSWFRAENKRVSPEVLA